MFKTLKMLVVAAVISAFSFATFAADSKKPTRIPVHNWSSQIVMAYVIGGIIEDMGGNVEYVPADSNAKFTSQFVLVMLIYHTKFGNLHSVNHLMQHVMLVVYLIGVTMKLEL